MSYTIELSEEQYRKLENYHRKTRDPKLRDFFEDILKENNDVVDGNILYKELCNHDKVDLRGISVEIDFDRSMNFHGGEARYVCHNCWSVWDYSQKTIGKVENKKDKEKIKEKV